MRKEIYRMEDAGAWALLRRTRLCHLASVDPAGAPVLRALHPVLLGEAVYFHGAPAGEKLSCIGQRAVLCAEEVIAEIPSYFIDPERACPATTYYESAQAHGVIEAVSDEAEKAAALQALMVKYQPEGGHAPIDPGDPRFAAIYRKAVAGVLVLRLRVDHLDGKLKLGQNRGPDDLARVLEGLWKRGQPGDARAVDRLAHALRRTHPAQPLPPFLHAPEGALLLTTLGADDAAEAVALLRGAYWNDWVDADTLARAHINSSAWVGAREQRGPDTAPGPLIATARALSDGGKFALIYDVMIAPTWRGRSLGAAVLRLLLDHPAVRGAARVWLRTRDAQDFYRRFGFVPAESLPPRAYRSSELWLLRS